MGADNDVNGNMSVDDDVGGDNDMSRDNEIEVVICEFFLLHWHNRYLYHDLFDFCSFPSQSQFSVSSPTNVNLTPSSFSLANLKQYPSACCTSKSVDHSAGGDDVSGDDVSGDHSGWERQHEWGTTTPR
jgi:hypothetical protein